MDNSDNNIKQPLLQNQAFNPEINAQPIPYVAQQNMQPSMVKVDYQQRDQGVSQPMVYQQSPVIQQQPYQMPVQPQPYQNPVIQHPQGVIVTQTTTTRPQTRVERRQRIRQIRRESRRTFNASRGVCLLVVGIVLLFLPPLTIVGVLFIILGLIRMGTAAAM